MWRATKFAALGGLLFTMLGFSSAGNTADGRYDAIGKTGFVGHVRIEYSDLNLNDPADVHVLLARVTQASYQACGGDPKRHPSYRSQPVATLKVYKECQEDALQRAISAIGSPSLAQLLRDRSAPAPRTSSSTTSSAAAAPGSPASGRLCPQAG